MPSKYEVTIVFDPDLDDDGLAVQLEKVKGTVLAHGGSVEKQDLWGRRPLAYPMKKKSYGYYVVLVVEADNSFVADVRRQLKINDNVLRELIVVKDKYAPDFRAQCREESSSGFGNFPRGDHASGGRSGAPQAEVGFSAAETERSEASNEEV